MWSLHIRTYIVVRMYITVKGMSRQSIQRIKAMLLCIEYDILFVDTVDMKIEACNALNAMFVETVNTKDQSNAIVCWVLYLVCQHCQYKEQSMQCISWILRKLWPKLYRQCQHCWYIWKTLILSFLKLLMDWKSVVYDPKCTDNVNTVDTFEKLWFWVF